MSSDSALERPAIENAARLRITEIFYSLQGEGRFVGLPTLFVRLTGCPLRCSYCDTAYAFSGGEWHSLEGVIATVAEYECQHVTVTGGEPLAQRACLPLLTRLCDRGFQVSLETSGALDLAAVDLRVVKVMDLKTPSSGESTRNHWDNLEHLTQRDQIKFVICNRDDFEWACRAVREHHLAEICEVIFSPCFAQLEPVTLAEWILAASLPVRFQIQLHKLLWGDVPGR